MEDTLYIEQMITGSFVKYNRLSEMIYTSYAGSQATEINLFIDLNSILKPMYSIDRWSYKYRNPYEITATILNMCGHYRDFFRQIGVSTNIYLIYGLNCPETNESFVKGYNSKFLESYIKKPDTTQMIQNNLDILNLICQYLPKIYFFDAGNNEVSAMIDYLITTLHAKERGLENIVISKDILMLQLVPEQNVRVIRPLKTKDGDESFIVDNSNFWLMYCTKYKKIKLPKEPISNTFISNVLTMTGVPERGIFSKLASNVVFRILHQGIRNKFLDPNTFYTQSVMNSVLAAMDIGGFNPVEMEMRFKAINTYFQSTYVVTMEKPEFKRLRLIDLEDVESLKEIVTKYFDNVPIDLDRL